MKETLPTVVSPSRDLSLDLLRGSAILYIVGYYHIQNVWMIHLPGGLAGWLARIALALFCFLSGFLLGKGKPVADWPDAVLFLKRRFLRIYPLYLAFLAIFLALGLFPRPLFWPSALLINTLLNWNLLTLWFVSMISLFYLVTPLFLHRPRPAKTLSLGAAIFCVLAFLHLAFRWIDPRLFANLPPFILGIYLTQSARLRPHFLFPRRTTLVASTFAILLLAWFTAGYEPQDATLSTVVLALLWFLASLPCLLAGARALSKNLPHRAISALASASFILYLSHRIFYFLGEKMLPLAGWERLFYYLFLLLPLALTFSFYLQKAYNRVFR